MDAGLPASLLGKPIDHQPISPTLSVDLPTQLARIGVRPEDITRLGLSHYHFDHAGQAATFPNAKLMIGAADWAALHDRKMPFGADPTLLALLDQWESQSRSNRKRQGRVRRRFGGHSCGTAKNCGLQRIVGAIA